MPLGGLQAAQKRREADKSRLQATAEDARSALHIAEEARKALQFKCSELVVALEDVTQQKERTQALLHKEREEVRRSRPQRCALLHDLMDARLTSFPCC